MKLVSTFDLTTNKLGELAYTGINEKSTENKNKNVIQVEDWLSELETINIEEY